MMQRWQNMWDCYYDYEPIQVVRKNLWMQYWCWIDNHRIRSFCSPMEKHDDNYAILHQMQIKQPANSRLDWCVCHTACYLLRYRNKSKHWWAWSTINHLETINSRFYHINVRRYSQKRLHLVWCRILNWNSPRMMSRDFHSKNTKEPVDCFKSFIYIEKIKWDLHSDWNWLRLIVANILFAFIENIASNEKKTRTKWKYNNNTNQNWHSDRDKSKQWNVKPFLPHNKRIIL